VGIFAVRSIFDDKRLPAAQFSAKMLKSMTLFSELPCPGQRWRV